jgi:hypothetical protein
LNGCCFYFVGGFEFLRKGFGGGGVVGVVDGDVGALGREGAGDFGAETSGTLLGRLLWSLGGILLLLLFEKWFGLGDMWPLHLCG